MYRKYSPLRSLSSMVTLLALLLFVMSWHSTFARTFYVPDGDVPGLIAAINEANSNGEPDTIELAPNGTYTLTSPDPLGGSRGPTGLPAITSEITISGNGSTIQRSTASGTPNFRIFYIANSGNLTLNDLTVSHGRNAGASPSQSGAGIFNDQGTVALSTTTISNNHGDFLGGGITNDGSMIIENSIVTNNVALDGGGIFNGFHGSLELIGSTISNNSANFGGGIFNDNGGDLIVNHSTFVGNSASWWGGGIAHVSFGGGADLGTVLTVENESSFTNNSANQGGAIYTNTGVATVASGTLIKDNEASQQGGGIYNTFNGALSLTDVTIQDNDAGSDGGGIWNNNALTLDNTTVRGNKADRHGGGLFHQEDQATIKDSTIKDNKAGFNGGGIYNGTPYSPGTLIIDNTSIRANDASENAGGIWNDGGLVEVSASEIRDNTAVEFGGGVWNNNQGTMNIDLTTIRNNHAPFGGGVDNQSESHMFISQSTIRDNEGIDDGGGIHNTGVFAIEFSTIENNEAESAGGIYNAGSLTMLNSTISRNHASDDGGGLANRDNLSLYNVTITANEAVVGGGLSNVGIIVKRQNSIIAGNYATNSNDCIEYGQQADMEGYNLLGESCTAFANDLVLGQGALAGLEIDDVLDSLDDNGGPTETHDLVSGSPAIDAGSLTGCIKPAGDLMTVDQRFFPRPVDGNGNGEARCDIGSVEKQ